MLHDDRPRTRRPAPCVPPRAVLLWARADRREALDAAARARDFIVGRGVGVLVEQATADALGETGVPLEDCLASADLALVFGGDGAVVSLARAAAPWGVPVVGVNFGTFGFLAEIEAGTLRSRLAALCRGAYDVDRRLMLHAVIGAHETLLAANDVAVKAKDAGRILELRIKLGDDLIAEFPADGVVVATATGSTAYNLSAGGPVLMPGVPAMVLTPICPHTLATRPLVLSAEARLTIEVVEAPRTSHSALVSVDGQIHRELAPGELLLVEQSPTCLPLARLEHGAFFHSLRGKLGWGLPR
ncbi:MAG: NAD(+)/NADH kinase [Armatimonadetes bacterium]|nr:NAD(+)/NADH kinase [Armatimonadota bacterium]